MKRFMLIYFVAFTLIAHETIEASLIPIQRSRMKKIKDRKTTEPPRICLYPPIDLPACNFENEDVDSAEKSLRQKRALAQLDYSEMYEDPEDLTIRENPKIGYTRALTIVYKIEGCIPSRLPFVIPLCKRQDSIGRIIEVRRLFPFKVTGKSTDDHGVPLVFPEMDMDQWNKLMQGPWIRPINDKDKAEVKKASFEESTETPSKLPKRKKFYDAIVTKRKTHEKIMNQRDTKDFEAKKIFLKFQSSLENDGGNRDYQLNDDVSLEKRKNRLNGLKDMMDEREEDKVRRLVIEKVLMRYQDEFPYEVAIPYDPTKLQVARPGSEFPYARAIPYDPKKLEERRESDRTMPFYSRSLKVMKETNFHDVPFDSRMLSAAKDGGTFPYAKDIPDDTSRIVSTMEQPRTNKMEKVPMRQEESTRKIRDILTDEKSRKKDRPSRSIVESKNLSTIDDSDGDEVMGIPRPWSEFPYSKAIPFDPEKLRRPRSSMRHRDSRDVTIPLDFPYSKAIPYDPTKLNAARRKKSQSRETRSIGNEKKKTLIDRLKRASMF